MHFTFALVLSLLSLFLILLVLVQRGRGGGLTGALGGMGGQSAFGTKAGDTFTRVTIISATIWICLAILAVKLLGGKGGGILGDADAADVELPDLPAATSGAGGATTTDSPLDKLPATGGGAATSATDGATTGTPDAEPTPE